LNPRLLSLNFAGRYGVAEVKTSYDVNLFLIFIVLVTLSTRLPHAEYPSKFPADLLLLLAFDRCAGCSYTSGEGILSILLILQGTFEGLSARALSASALLSAVVAAGH
jgi:hypothetical protein